MILICCFLIFGVLQAVDAMDMKMGPDFRELPSFENRFVDFDTRIESKLAQMESAFEKKLNSVETFYKQKLIEIEKRLSESEKRQKRTNIFYKNKLAEMKNSYSNIEENRHSREKFHELILVKVEKRLNNIEKRLEAVEKSFSSKTEHEKSDTGKRKVVANVENTELKSSNNIINTEQEVNVSTPEMVRHAMQGSDTDALKVNDSSLESTVCASLNRRLTPSGNNRVAFTAYISSATVTELGREHTIPFDQVLLNEGQAFDTVFHAFVCPVNGIYMFQSAVLSTHENLIQTEIVKDGVTIVIMYAAGATGSDGYDQGFNSAIIQCNKGERVWVRVYGHYGTDLLGSRYSTFSGYLLWEI